MECSIERWVGYSLMECSSECFLEGLKEGKGLQQRGFDEKAPVGIDAKALVGGAFSLRF